MRQMITRRKIRFWLAGQVVCRSDIALGKRRQKQNLGKQKAETGREARSPFQLSIFLLSPRGIIPCPVEYWLQFHWARPPFHGVNAFHKDAGQSPLGRDAAGRLTQSNLPLAA